jgi:hypothetical protein
MKISFITDKYHISCASSWLILEEYKYYQQDCSYI